MNSTDWYTFVGAQTELENRRRTAGSDPANPNTLPALIPMANHRLLTITGPDAEKFLQGQCTCDFRRLSDGDVLLGAHCTPKGRMISSFVAARLQSDTIALRVCADIADLATAALRKYIVFSKARIEVSETHVPLAIIGSQAATLTSDLEGMPATDGKFAPLSSGTAIRHNEDWLELWLPVDEAHARWHQLAPLCRPSTPAEWDLRSIQAGIGEVRAQTTEEFIPQMLNLQLLDGISFKKGCYTGQEIVARMHYLGKLKKHMYRATLSAEHPLPAPGTPLYLPSNSTSQGTVVMAATAQQNHQLLVVTSQEVREQGQLSLDANLPANLEWAELPYAIT